MSIFDTVKMKRPPKNTFNLSFRNKLTGYMGKIMPIGCLPTIPDDEWRWNTEIFIRLAPMMYPIMDDIDVRVEYMYCPNRILFNDEREWEKFISPAMKNDGSPVPETTPPSFVPEAKTAPANKYLDWSEGELLDLLGYRPLNETSIPCSLLPINMYNKCYYEYYQDENVASWLDDNLDYPLLGKSGGYGINNDWIDVFKEKSSANFDRVAKSYFRLRLRSWKKDYFTSALPWTQRGADVHLPLYGDAAIDVKDPSASPFHQVLGAVPWSSTASPDQNHPEFVQYYSSLEKDKTAIDPVGEGRLTLGNVGSSAPLTLENPTTGRTVKVAPNQNSIVGNYNINDIVNNIKVDMSAVNAATINEFRRANALQKYLEISARTGARYKEFVYGHFGVNIPDARLQRPEYLSGWRMPVRISEVIQTNDSDTSPTPLGEMAGHGVGYASSHGFKKYIYEHGYIMCFLTIMPKASYFQGIKRDLLKMDRLDWYSPSFANIGEQPIYSGELYAAPDSSGSIFETFGYTPRYAEYKVSLDEIHGAFRSTLSRWHLARIFGSKPVLNDEFITVDENRDKLNRIFSVETGVEHFYISVNHDIKVKRPMPRFGTPIL